MTHYTLPNLFVPGAMKSGTSALHEYLSRHPDIFMSRSKEPHYLVRQDKGIDYYDIMFGGAGQARYRGESSTGYMVSKTAVTAIGSLISDPKFIFILRNPVDRAWSHYHWFGGQYGQQSRTFRDMFLEDYYATPLDPMPINTGYYHIGCYDKWLRMYLEEFDSKQMFVILFEELVSQPLETLNRICDFLQIEPYRHHFETMHANKTSIVRFPALLRGYSLVGLHGGKAVRHVLSQPAQMRLLRVYQAGERQLGRKLAVGIAPRVDVETRVWLAQFYRDSVESLRALTGFSLDDWSHDFP